MQASSGIRRWNWSDIRKSRYSSSPLWTGSKKNLGMKESGNNLDLSFFFIKVSIFEKSAPKIWQLTSTALYLSISILRYYLSRFFLNFHRSIKSIKGSVDRTGTGTTKQQELTRPSTIVTHAHLHPKGANIFWTENNGLQILYGYPAVKSKTAAVVKDILFHFSFLDRCTTLTWRYSDVKLTQISCILSDLKPTIWLQNSSRVVKTYARFELYNLTSLASALQSKFSWEKRQVEDQDVHSGFGSTHFHLGNRTQQVLFCGRHRVRLVVEALPSWRARERRWKRKWYNSRFSFAIHGGSISDMARNRWFQKRDGWTDDPGEYSW